MLNLETNIINFSEQITKKTITTLQINLGKKCNLACNHCHVESSPVRTEELSEKTCIQLQQIIERFPQIKTVDLTGGAPEMNYGFQQLVDTAVKAEKEVIVRSNLTIFFESEYEYLPEYFTKNRVRIIASLPCYLEDNVDKQRGKGVYNKSIKAINILNNLGYGIQPELILDLVYNPQITKNNNFSLTPNQEILEKDYKKYLKENYNLSFNQLLTIINLPIGRVKETLKNQEIYQDYLQFLQINHNADNVDHVMCRDLLSVDYLGNIYDCDFNQMENISAVDKYGQKITLKYILEKDNLDIIKDVKTANYCYGCTAGSGSSCGGALKTTK